MLECSKTYNANATECLLQTELPYCTAEGAHTVAETVLEPRAVEMATCVLGAQSKKKQTVQLSNNTVTCRIQDVSRYRKATGVATFNPRFPFSSQLDDSPDVPGVALVLASVRRLFRAQNRGRFAVRIYSAQTSSVSHNFSEQSSIFRVCGYRIYITTDFFFLNQQSEY